MICDAIFEFVTCCQRVPQNTPHDKCGRERTAKRHFYVKPMVYSFYKLIVI